MSGGEVSTLEAHSGGSLPPGQGTPGTKRTIGDDRGVSGGEPGGGGKKKKGKGVAKGVEGGAGGSEPVVATQSEPGLGGIGEVVGFSSQDLVGTMSGGTGIGTPMASTGMELACVGVEDPMSGGTGVGTPLASTGTELGMAGGDPMDSGGGGV
ncbi:hypothetical protein DPEC_G00303050 [Dallia pectoralis]|uniref:Uncharacterized protein n=1 Tax=Dallia pectoralis TaxID=75939 RepID=A0ACC2FH48_DALPE|nr:hypothetical protein DPEC_G00303050 [Dallia pectoralis]